MACALQSCQENGATARPRSSSLGDGRPRAERKLHWRGSIQRAWALAVRIDQRRPGAAVIHTKPVAASERRARSPRALRPEAVEIFIVSTWLNLMIGPPRRRDRKPSLARPAPLFALLVALLGWATGCGSAFGQNGAALGPDAPVAADEPRATLRLQLTLPFAPDCEEAFDLALYANRGVELIDDRLGRRHGLVQRTHRDHSLSPQAAQRGRACRVGTATRRTRRGGRAHWRGRARVPCHVNPPTLWDPVA